jgi:hypothetical protein
MRGNSLLIGVVVLVALIGGAVWAARPTWQTARLGTVYVAKQTCSCLFIAKRTEASCRTDYNPDDLARLAVKPDPSGSVSVSALGGLISAKAEYAEGFGCHPAN